MDPGATDGLRREGFDLLEPRTARPALPAVLLAALPAPLTALRSAVSLPALFSMSFWWMTTSSISALMGGEYYNAPRATIQAMKLVIEVEQINPQATPTVRVSVDGEPISVVERLEFSANVSKTHPVCVIRFPSLGKVLALDPEVKTTVEGLKQKIAVHKKKLADFKSWLTVR
jgi:hypothetical protein